MVRTLIVCAVAASLWITSSVAIAATSTAGVTVSATITTSCTFASHTTTLDITSLAVQASGASLSENSSITCSAGYPYTVAASPGNMGTCGSPGGRFLAAGTNKVSYDLILASTEWCNVGPGTTEWSSTGTGAVQQIPYNVVTVGYAIDPLNGNRPNPYPPGAYTDAITLTATF